MTKDEALKLALEALEHEAKIGNDDAYKLERDVIKEALAQPEQKSVAMADYMALTEKYVALKATQPEQERFLVATIGNWGRVEWADGVFPSLGDKMYSAPRTWVGLTDEEMGAIYEQHHNQYGECESANLGYERAIESKLKEKNEFC